MPFTFSMPKLSPTMEEGTITKWHKQEGDFVQSGELLLEIATDKATVEYNALDEGYLRKILIKEGGEASVNQIIAIISENIEENIEDLIPKKEEKKIDIEESEGTKEIKEEVKKTSTSMQQPQFVPYPSLNEKYSLNPQKEERLKASPLARKIAKDKKLDLSSVKGSGPGGRIVKKDLEKASLLSDISLLKENRASSYMAGSYQEEQLSPMRKTISRRLQESKTFIPHFYLTQVIDAEPLYTFREQLNNLGVKVSFNDCIIKATAFALKKHPNINAGFNSVNQTVINYQTIDVAVAVSLPEGLITPIIRFADLKNINEISSEVRYLANKAKNGKLEPEEYQGGSFTISNLGMYGISEFKAIINPPQACILAVGGINDVPVVKKGIVVPGKTMNLTLSVDHRVVDGVAGAIFLNKIKYYLENPVVLAN